MFRAMLPMLCEFHLAERPSSVCVCVQPVSLNTPEIRRVDQTGGIEYLQRTILAMGACVKPILAVCVYSLHTFNCWAHNGKKTPDRYGL